VKEQDYFVFFKPRAAVRDQEVSLVSAKTGRTIDSSLMRGAVKESTPSARPASQDVPGARRGREALFFCLTVEKQGYLKPYSHNHEGRSFSFFQDSLLLSL
jgi:hypothetical protein